MSVILPSRSPRSIIYPESDGKPMADNTKQARWIVILFDNLLALFADIADVFIAADNFWYPVEGEPGIRIAPDVLIAFGRPRGDRASYKQWEEGGIAPQIVFEILSPGNTHIEMVAKLDFYEQHGVEEYYLYDPDNNRLCIYVRCGEHLRRVKIVDGFVSPRLGIRFQISAPEMSIYRPDDRPFHVFDQVEIDRIQIEEALQQAEQQAARAAVEIERLRRLLDATGQSGEQA